MAGMEVGKPGKLYWVQSSPERAGEGIVVVVAWMLSQRRHLEPYTRLYADSRCDSLVCHPHVLNLWFPSRAEAVAVQILDAILKEVESKPRPIVFATFSGGREGVLVQDFSDFTSRIKGGGQVRPCEGMCARSNSRLQPCRLCQCGGCRFATFSVSQRLGRSVFGLPAMSKAVANLVDALFWSEIELQREDYLLTLKESSRFGPFLILCCTNDELSPFDFIHKFARVVRDSGCAVDLVVWDASDHVGHFRNFPKEYHAAVKSFLDQRLALATGTPPEDTATVRTENEVSLAVDKSETIPPEISRFPKRANLVSTQETRCQSRNPPLNSKL